MTKRVLITGTPDHVEALAKVFSAADIEHVTLAQIGPGASEIDYYVQLGVTVPARGDTVVRRVHSFLNDGLLDRFTIVERVLPMLADNAVVLLVAGNLPAEVAAPDDRAARLSLLTVLAHAIRADLAPKRVRVRVISSDRSDEDIAAFALSGAKDPEAALPLAASEGPDSDRTYEDWRIQVLGLAHIEL
ncbi:MAG: hypothetical protein ABI345_11490 [Jatrophihabitans sp.]